MRREVDLARQVLEYGLESADSISDRSISLFERKYNSYSSGYRFMGVPFLENMNMLGGQDVVILGVPLESGTTLRSGTRWGPQAIRQNSLPGTGYNPSTGVDLAESLNIVDVGDVNVIPADIEKSFDQIVKAVSYLYERGGFPVILGGDHLIGYPDILGLAPYVEGNIGIIHFDRHADVGELDTAAGMDWTPWFHASNILNAPPTNLVHIGVGGWTQPHGCYANSRERRSTIFTMEDVDQFGLDRIAEYALEAAWKGAKCVFLSFDMDCFDPTFAPGTRTAESGGFLPREVFRLLDLVAREGLIGMEVVEVSPQHDVANLTSLLASRLIMNVLGTLVLYKKLGHIPFTEELAPLYRYNDEFQDVQD